MDIEQARERERYREREKEKREGRERGTGSERDREEAKEKDRERKQAVGGALVCSTSLPGGNQVDGLPPALVLVGVTLG